MSESNPPNHTNRSVFLSIVQLFTHQPQCGLITSMKKLALIALLGIATASVALAQGEKPAPTPTPTPQPAPVRAANPADVASIESIIAAVYDVISGPAGKKRDWDRMQSLFAPGARLIPTGPRQAGGYGSRVLSVDDYIQRSSPFLEKEGFYERETSRVVEQFGQIAHVFSTYDSKHSPTDAKPFARGINSIQLMNDGQRWWILTIFWQGEDEKNPLPEKYLNKM
jgi:hypothetical protein